MPPPSRNHRVPTAGDTPATTPASSLEDRQRPLARSVTDARAALPAGRPGDSIAGLPVAAAAHLLAAPSTHLLIEACDDHLNHPVHLGAARAVRPRAQPGPLRWPHGGVGQRSGRIILGHTQSRVLRQIPMADQTAAKPRSRRLDRTSLADADATRPSVSSARSTSKTDSLRPHKPPDPVSTNRVKPKQGIQQKRRP